MYEQHILKVFSDVGRRGISVSLLAKHVYNMNCTLFSQPDFGEVLRESRNFVVRNSRSRRGLLERTDRWGFYRLNVRGMALARQQLQQLDGGDREEPEKEEKPRQDFSLNLFSEEFSD